MPAGSARGRAKASLSQRESLDTHARLGALQKQYAALQLKHTRMHDSYAKEREKGVMTQRKLKMAVQINQKQKSNSPSSSSRGQRPARTIQYTHGKQAVLAQQVAGLRRDVSEERAHSERQRVMLRTLRQAVELRAREVSQFLNANANASGGTKDGSSTVVCSCHLRNAASARMVLRLEEQVAFLSREHSQCGALRHDLAAQVTSAVSEVEALNEELVGGLREEKRVLAQQVMIM
jgi:hypothetical protein